MAPPPSMIMWLSICAQLQCWTLVLSCPGPWGPDNSVSATQLKWLSRSLYCILPVFKIHCWHLNLVNFSSIQQQLKLTEQTQVSDGDVRILPGWFWHKTVPTKTHMTFYTFIIMIVTVEDAASGGLRSSLKKCTTWAIEEAALLGASAVWMLLLIVRPYCWHHK